MKKIFTIALSILSAVAVIASGNGMLLTSAESTATDKTGWGSVLNSAGTLIRSTGYTTYEMKETAQRAAEEGAVLLKNDNAALPLKSTDTVAVFGSRQLCDTSNISEWGYLAGGAGSGAVWGSIGVSPIEKLREKADRGKFNLYDTISNNYEKQPTRYTPSDADLAAAKKAGVNKAIFIISRFEGEGGVEESTFGSTADPDSKAIAGEWYLSRTETALLQKLDSTFDQVIVVLNTGNLMDTNFIKNGIDGKQVVDAALASWYGGNMGPQAMANLLVGDVNPSGKLVQTAAPIENYPTTENFGNVTYTNYEEDIFVGYRYFETFDKNYEKVNYEFGYGLSYTDFSISDIKYSYDKTYITVEATIKNVGNTAGKEVFQVYYSAPQMGTGTAKLSKAGKELGGFVKTKTLHPGASQTVTVTFPIKDMASYDDTGVTGKKSAWVLEAGDYTVYAGTSVKNVSKAGTYTVKSLTVTEQLTEQMQPSQLSKRLLANGQYELLSTGNEYVSPTDAGTETTWTTPSVTVTYDDVKSGKKTLQEFVSQMTVEELASFTAGTKMSGSAGGAGVGGSSEVESKYGVPVSAVLDGPAGPNTYSWAFPSNMCIASTWNLDIVADYGTVAGKYLDESTSDPVIWQAAINIQRNPLGGRNFEYYSEDPLITGLMGATLILRAQEQGIGMVVKHLAVNNQETGRGGNDSRVSERALREIYLKGFEIILKEANPASVMTSYNRVNGVYSFLRSDMLINVIRNEWGWQGMYMSDWDAVGTKTVEMILAHQNIKMGQYDAAFDYSDVITAYNSGIIKRSVLEENAMYVINALINSQTDYSGPDDKNSVVPSDEIFANGTGGSNNGNNNGNSNYSNEGNNGSGYNNSNNNSSGYLNNSDSGISNADDNSPQISLNKSFTSNLDGIGFDPVDIRWAWAVAAVIAACNIAAIIIVIVKRRKIKL